MNNAKYIVTWICLLWLTIGSCVDKFNAHLPESSTRAVSYTHLNAIFVFSIKKRKAMGCFMNILWLMFGGIITAVELSLIHIYNRLKFIILSVAVAELSLVLFGALPRPLNVFALFFNRCV